MKKYQFTNFMNILSIEKKIYKKKVKKNFIKKKLKLKKLVNWYFL